MLSQYRAHVPADDPLERRAAIHAALGEPARLAIVDELRVTDRSPGELAHQLHLSTNLLTHHLDVLESLGLIERIGSSGDRRRKYVRLRHGPLAALDAVPPPRPARTLFLCTHNSARSQLAAALWTARTGTPALSAGTHPAERVSSRSHRCRPPRRAGSAQCRPEDDRCDRSRRAGGHRVRQGPRGTRRARVVVALVDP